MRARFQGSVLRSYQRHFCSHSLACAAVIGPENRRCTAPCRFTEYRVARVGDGRHGGSQRTMFRSLLAAMAACALVPATSMAATHTVAPGETLWGIAYANNLATSAVAAANGLSPEARVVAGTNLTIPAPGQAPTPPVTPAPSSPGTASAPAATGGGGYRVQPGDSLSAIAARQGVSLSALAAANGLKLDSWVIQGTSLRLPAPGSAPAATQTTAAARRPGAPEVMGAYKVRPGDTLSGLAAAARVPAAQMAYMNGLNPSAQLIAGTVIKLPTGASINATTPAPARDDRPAGRADGLAGPADGRAGRHAGRAVRRAVVAGLRHRVAGERLQQRDDLVGQRPRRHAGHARHVELGAGQPRRHAPGSVLADRQRQGRIALPGPPAARDERRPRDGGRRLLPGPRVGAPHRDAARDAPLRRPTCWPCAAASAADAASRAAGARSEDRAPAADLWGGARQPATHRLRPSPPPSRSSAACCTSRARCARAAAWSPCSRPSRASSATRWATAPSSSTSTARPSTTTRSP